MTSPPLARPDSHPSRVPDRNAATKSRLTWAPDPRSTVHHWHANLSAVPPDDTPVRLGLWLWRLPLAIAMLLVGLCLLPHLAWAERLALPIAGHASDGVPLRPAGADRSDANSFFDFDLPWIPTGQWLRPEDLGDRPLVVIRIASWSANCRRLLPLWQRQLEPAFRAGDIGVALIAEEQQWERAAWLCQQAGIDWPLLHDPLPERPSVEYPSVSVIDRHGRVIQPRLTLTLAASGTWGASPSEPVDSTPARARLADQALPTLWEEFRQQRQQSAPLVELQPLADHLLRRCFFDAPADSPALLAPLITYYREAFFSTQDAAWAFRLGVAHRLWFDHQHLLGSVQAEQWQESVNFLEWANRSSPAATTRPGATRGPVARGWEAWLQPYRPLVDRPTAAYVGPIDGTAPLFFSETTAQPASWKPAAAFVGERPIDFAAAVAAPWTSVRTQSVWVLGTAASADTGQWARLFLHVQLKRGDWDLTQPTHLDWHGETPPSDGPPPRWLPADVQASRSPAPAKTPATAPEPSAIDDRSTRATAVWLEADVWLPHLASGPSAGSEGVGPLPPARNATLYFYGQDPSTGHTTPRRLDFFLPPPTQPQLDW